MSAKMTKEKFMQTLRLERLKWRALLDEVGESRMLVPNAIGIWSVRDLIVHIAVWERWGASLAKAASEGRAATQAELWGSELTPEIEAYEDDRFNEWLVAKNSDKTLAQIVNAEGRIYQRFTEAVDALSEDDLIDPDRQFPGMEWKGDRPLWDVLANQSYLHYRLHAEDVRRWLSEQYARS